jgi:hypothetical protein
VAAQEAAYTDFLAKFDSYGFKTRTDARQKWQDLQDEANRKLEECKGKVDEKVKKAKSKFPTSADDLMGDVMKGLSDPQKYVKEAGKKQKEFAKNQEKANEFNNALKAASDNCEAKQAQIDEAKIKEKILTITPGQPDAALLKQILVNRRILEPAGGYFGNNWAWTIESADEIQSITIDKEEKVGNAYDIDATLILQGTAAQYQYEASLTITCILRPQDDDWSVDFIKTRDIHILKTGRYDECVKAELKSETNLQFTNSCDVKLIIGCQILNNNDEWIKFSIRVESNGTANINYYGKEYKIDFIERSN